MQLNLKEKVVVVTGGSKGIGRAIVQAFVTEGANVHFCARTQGAIQSTQETLSSPASKAGGTVTGHQVDMSIPTEIQNWITAIITTSHKIDIVISNVSSLTMTNDDAGWSKAFETDMLGAVTLVNACLPSLEETRGNILSISSVSGRDIDFTATSPNGAFKAAVIHYVAQLAHTLAPKGIRANAVSPGNIYIEDGVWGGIEKGNPEFFGSQMGKNVSGRMGKASEVADAVLFLASERASFISGTNLVVDGSLCTGVQF